MGIEDRVDRLVSELTTEEQCKLVHGASDPTGRATGFIPGIERLDIPPFRMIDGPLGVRVPNETATAFPAPLTLAATFDRELAHEYGSALARETKGKGMQAILAPGTNLIRVPQNGRNFEYFSEDPVQSAAFAASVTAGIEAEDVVATPKHFVANNQETDRASVDVDVSERALRELYLPSFEAAIEAGAGSVMTAYNAVNGTAMSEHKSLNCDVLKEEFGFDGYVVSDWFATGGAAASVNGGVDVEMPGVSMVEMATAMGENLGDNEANALADKEPAEAAGAAVVEDFEIPTELPAGMPDPNTTEHFADALVPAVESGEIPAERLEEMVRRVLTVMGAHGLLDGRDDSGAVEPAQHRNLAERIAAQGTVLLKNDGILPLADDADIAVIGPNVDEPVLGGGGSSETTAATPRSPIAGITDRANSEVTVAHGLPPVNDISMFDFFDPGDEDDEPDRKPDLAGAAAAAADADVAVVFVRDTVSEAMDRASLSLPGRQDELVEAVANANDRTVVVVNSSGPIEMPWEMDVAAVLEGWYPGQAHGDATAAVLYGDIDPAGRLPVTFAPADTYPTTSTRRFPGVDGSAVYDEGVMVGYRAFDASSTEPTYPFGHGHSYAEFTYGDVKLDDERASVSISNHSSRNGREVVQVYVRPPATDVERPVRELAGFSAVDIPAGGTETVEVALNDLAFRRYDESEGWTVDPGTYTIEVGRSSRDIRTEITAEY